MNSIKLLFFLLLCFSYSKEKTNAEFIINSGVEIPLERELSRREKRKEHDLITNNIILTETLEVGSEADLSEEVAEKLSIETFKSRRRDNKRYLEKLHKGVFKIFQSVQKKIEKRKQPKLEVRNKKVEKEYQKVSRLRIKPLRKDIFFMRKENKDTEKKELNEKTFNLVVSNKNNKADVISNESKNNDEMLPKIPVSHTFEFENDWKEKNPVDEFETALLVVMMDEEKQKQVSSWIEFTSYKGTFDPKDTSEKSWHTIGCIYKFSKGQILEYRVKETELYNSTKGYFYLGEPHQILRISLKKWTDTKNFPWQSIDLNKKFRLNGKGGFRKVQNLRKQFNAMGKSFVGVMHPIEFLKEDQIAMQLPYDVLWEMCMSENTSKSIWLPTQQFISGNIIIDVIGSSEEIKPNNGINEYLKLQSIILDGKKNGAVISMGNISETISMGNQQISPLPFLMYSGLLPDIMDVNNVDDLSVYQLLLEKGFLISHKESFLDHKSQKNESHLIYMSNVNNTFKDVLSKLKRGELISAKEMRINFYMEDGARKKWHVGERAIVSENGTLFRPKVEFVMRPKLKNAFWKIELILNGKKNQPTKFRKHLNSGIAVFEKLLLHPGDSIMLRLFTSDGREVLTNPIYTKKEESKVKVKKFIAVRILTYLSKDKKGAGFKVIARAKGFYKRFSGELGVEKTINLPLNTKIEIWNDEFELKQIDLFEMISERLMGRDRTKMDIKKGLEFFEDDKAFDIKVVFENES